MWVGVTYVGGYTTIFPGLVMLSTIVSLLEYQYEILIRTVDKAYARVSEN